MSIITNYCINGIDLSNILQPYTQFKTLNNTIEFLHIAASQNQTYIAGVMQNDPQVHVSSDSGQTWTGHALSGATMLNCMAINSTGQYMLTANAGGYIYVSSTYGSSWTSLVYSGYLWNIAAVSNTGQYMVICSSGGTFFYSTNYGASFTATSSVFASVYCYGICMDLTASNIFASTSSGMYYSTNFGNTWTSMTASLIAGTQNSQQIACNSNGTQIIRGTYSKGVYILDKSSGSWVDRNTGLPATYNSMSVQYSCVSSDPTGQYLVASSLVGPNQNPGFIYYSTDYGETWIKLNGSAGSKLTSSLSSINNNSFIFNQFNSTGLYKYHLFNYNIPNTQLYTLGTDLTNYYLPPQGTSTIYSASWESTLTPYLFNNIDILTNFAPLTTIYNSSGSFTHNLKSSTQRWAVLLVAGGGGGMGGTQYSGGSNGAGGGGGASGQWVFAYSNASISNRSLNLTIGNAGTGSIGTDSTSAYQYPLTQPTNGGNSSIVINGTTILQVFGGNCGQGWTAGNVGSFGGTANTTAITSDSSITVFDYSNGIAGSNGSNATSGHPPGGIGGQNSFSSIEINNNFSYITNTQNIITLSNYGEGGNGGYGEGTSSNAGGCENGFNGTNGLAIIFEYQLPSNFLTTMLTSKLITATTSTLINMLNTVTPPFGYNYINFYLYGAGGNGNNSNTNYVGAGAGSFLFAKNIPFNASGTTITSIKYTLGAGGAAVNTTVNITYSDNSVISLIAGPGLNVAPSSTNGVSGGIASRNNTTTFYSNTNITLVNGTAGGNQNVTGTSNGYTSSGSGGNATNPASNSSSASKLFVGNDSKNYTITSYGGGSNRVVSGYGAGGAATPSNYNSNATAYRYGSQGVILYTLDINTI